MDWFRRNWPDLIIGVALVAVIAAIVATLLSGGSLPSLNARSGQPAEPAVSQPSAPDTQTGALADAEDNVTSDTSAPPEEGGVEPVVPDLLGNAPTDTDEPTNAPQASNSAVTPAPPSEADPEPSALDEPTTASPNDASPNDTASAQATDTTQPAGISYRVSVGAFSTREGAERVVESYTSEGLPAFVASQGDLNLALVGPYANEAEANRVAQQIIDAGGEAIVYTYEGPEENAPATRPNGAAAPEASADAGASTVEGGAAAPSTSADGADSTAPTSGTFLQAGAFGSAETALPRREQIETLGYSVSERETTSGLVRLFVGPLRPNELDEAQAQLQTIGIESFPVTVP